MPRRLLMRDPAAPHQIVIYMQGRGGKNIAVSCNCQLRSGSYRPLEVRARWEPEEILERYRQHLPA